MLSESLSLCREVSRIIGDRKIVWQMISDNEVLVLVPRLVMVECPNCYSPYEMEEAKR